MGRQLLSPIRGRTDGECVVWDLEGIKAPPSNVLVRTTRIGLTQVVRLFHRLPPFVLLSRGPNR